VGLGVNIGPVGVEVGLSVGRVHTSTAIDGVQDQVLGPKLCGQTLLPDQVNESTEQPGISRLAILCWESLASRTHMAVLTPVAVLGCKYTTEVSLSSENRSTNQMNHAKGLFVVPIRDNATLS